MSAKKRTAKFVAPKDDAKDAYSSDDHSAGSDDDDFAFYQSRFPLPTNAPKPSRRPASSSSSQHPSQKQQRQSDEWVEVHDTRKDKYQQRRTAREAELAALQAEAEDNRRNEFSTLPRFVPYVRDAAGKWLGGKSVHKAKPKQLGVIEDYIIPDPHASKHNKKKKNNDLLLTTASASAAANSSSSKEWSSEADMVEGVVHWIERQIGEEVMTVAQIGERIQARVGESWNKRYRHQYGPLLDWLRSKQHFIVQGDRVTVRPRQEGEEGEEEHERDGQQRQQRREVDDTGRTASKAAKRVKRAQRSWLAFLVYALVLLVVGFGAYSVWSGRNMSDLARQLAQQLDAMEAQVADVKQAAAAEHSHNT